MPALLFLKLTACSDQDNPQNAQPTDDGGGADGSVTPPGDSGTDAPVTTGSRGSCAVTKKGTAGYLLKGRLLLPEEVKDGEVLVDAYGLIRCAGASCQATPPYAKEATYKAALAAATEVTCKDAVISPGLINPHDHISYAHDAPKPYPKGGKERYEHRHDWRKGLRDHTALVTPGGAKPEQVLAAELRFLMSGATATASAGGQNGLIRNLDDTPSSLENARVKIVDSQTFPLNDANPGTGWPFTQCSQFAAARDTAVTVQKYDGYLPHIAEGIDDIAHLETLCTSDEADPNHVLLAKQTAVIHGIGVDAKDIAKYRATQTALIWSPRSNVSLYGNTAQVTTYDNLGVQIALGTDWLPSGSMNMSRELKCADDLNKTYFGKHFTDKALWKMVTMNAAFALGAQSSLGMLKPGLQADIAIFDAAKSKDYRAVIDSSPEDVIAVMRGGTVLYGDSDFLSQDGLSAKDCEDLDVCGVKKKACVKKDTSTTLAALESVGKTIYPLFFCKDKVPTNEPSCVPYRDTNPTTAPMASLYTKGAGAPGDKDGDGVPDAMDNCPDVFNPIRPQDGAKQADVDGDGVGDVCDKCPTESGQACTPPSADDIDGDGVPNGTDNCAEIANPDQADDDKDGKGNVCDPCPNDPNVGEDFCPQPFTVAALRDPTNPSHPASGKVRGRVTDLYVVGVRNQNGSPRGFFAQLSSTDPFSAVFVNTSPLEPTVKVGNKIDVEGDYEELFTLTALSRPVIDVKDPGTTLPFSPLVVTTGSVNDTGTNGESYEGMLCELGPTTVTIKNADNPTDDPAVKTDFDEFVVDDGSGGLRVDDYLFDPLDNTYPVGKSWTKIVGICGFSFTHRKIWPRSFADLQ